MNLGRRLRQQQNAVDELLDEETNNQNISPIN